MRLLRPEEFEAEALRKLNNDTIQWMAAVVIAAHYASGGRPLANEEVGQLPEIKRLRELSESGQRMSPRYIGEQFALWRDVTNKVP